MYLIHFIKVNLFGYMSGYMYYKNVNCNVRVIHISSFCLILYMDSLTAEYNT